MKAEIVCGVLICSLPATELAYAQKRADYTLTVRVQNEAAVASWLLSSAEEETTRVFRQMGVALRWSDYRTVSDLDGASPEVSIVLMSAEMGARKSRIEQLPDRILARASQRTGRAYVFCDRVTQTATRHALSESIVLARTFTHELGHMIANVEHDAHGIMRETLELHDAGFFGFTDAQQRAIRDSLATAAATGAPRLALRVGNASGR